MASVYVRRRLLLVIRWFLFRPDITSTGCLDAINTKYLTHQPWSNSDTCNHNAHDPSTTRRKKRASEADELRHWTREREDIGRNPGRGSNLTPHPHPHPPPLTPYPRSLLNLGVLNSLSWVQSLGSVPCFTDPTPRQWKTLSSKLLGFVFVCCCCCFYLVYFVKIPPALGID